MTYARSQLPNVAVGSTSGRACALSSNSLFTKDIGKWFIVDGRNVRWCRTLVMILDFPVLSWKRLRLKCMRRK